MCKFLEVELLTQIENAQIILLDIAKYLSKRLYEFATLPSKYEVTYFP